MRLADAIVQRKGDAWAPQQQAIVEGSLPRKNYLVSCEPMTHVTDIELIRTYTLYRSQKAKKVKVYILLNYLICFNFAHPSFIAT